MNTNDRTRTAAMNLPMERLPSLRIGTRRDHNALARQHNLPDEIPERASLLAAEDAGILRFAEFIHAGGTTTVWVITDSTRRAAELGHLDGPPLRDENGKIANRVVFGDASWPIGATELGIERPPMLVRGVTEILAGFYAYHFSGFAIVGMLEDVPISSVALNVFRNRTVVLADLLDPAADGAFEEWRRQLLPVARYVHTLTVADRNGQPPRSLLETICRAPSGPARN